MREEKRCPDCAELVHAQARVCHYCGYRFASVLPTTALGWIRRPAEPRPLPALLLDWGVELSVDEDVAFFGLCAVESEGGFLLLTDRRLVVFAQRGSRRLLDWTPQQLREVEVEGGRGRARLRLSGEQGSVTLRHFASRSALSELVEALAAARAPGSAPPSQRGPDTA